MQLLRKLAFPISLVYALVVYIRNFLFDIGFFKVKSFGTTTICVGNLSVGGTGKTPMIEFLIELLKDSFKVAVISRGYRRKSKGFVLARSESKIEELGDEPYQIHSKFPGITVAVDEDRCRGILNLEKGIKPDVILLDDAFQHRKVKPTYSILLTAFGKLYPTGWYLPTGDLRDSKKEAKRADLIIVTKCPANLSENQQTKIVDLLKPKSHQHVLFSYLNYSKNLKGDGQSLILSQLLGKKVTLVTGIADAKPLVGHLIDQGIDIAHLEYKDHHFFSPSEIATFNSSALVLTTEKDYVRLKGKVKNLFYISVKHGFMNEDKAFLMNALKKIM
ncbi:MAG: tetraacyldisaccharide 4'-kinase [Maribacter sp.]